MYQLSDDEIYFATDLLDQAEVSNQVAITLVDMDTDEMDRLIDFGMVVLEVNDFVIEHYSHLESVTSDKAIRAYRLTVSKNRELVNS